MRKFLREYFSFSPSEIRVLILLSTLIIISLVVRLFFPIPEFQSYSLSAKDQAVLDSFMNSLEKINYETIDNFEHVENQYNIEIIEPIPIYTYFNPNTISQNELEEMNFPHVIARNLLRYREAGGKFYKKSDFKKLYGVTDSIYMVLEEYILISGDEKIDTIKFKTIEKQILELNTADSIQLLSISGIGPYFAGKIVNYRKRLGGYYNVDQLKEIKGMDSLKFETIQTQLKLDTSFIVQRSLNSLNANDLKAHPYISYRLAESILKYREFNKGKVELKELLENHIITEQDFIRISPYLYSNLP